MSDKALLTINERPDLSKEYPAIDGIAKGERPTLSEAPNREYFLPAEEAIRPDVLEILTMPTQDFYAWYDFKYQSCLEELQKWTAIGKIPYLEYGRDPNNLDANGYVMGIIRILTKGLDYLEKMKQRWKELQG